MRRRSFLALAAALACRPPVFAAAAAQNLAAHPRARAFIEGMAQKRGFSPAALSAIFARLHINDKVLELNGASPQPAAAPRKKTYWREYQKKRLSGKNIVAGKNFMRANLAALQRADKEHGVPPAVVTAIIGIETRYGEFLGTYPVAETLATLAFAHPSRGELFLLELEEFLLYARDMRIDPLHLTGSYAGAFGIPQFLPSSARKFAVDYDNNGAADLFSVEDAIGSVANYLRGYGWRRELGIGYRAQIVGDAAAAVAAGEAAEFRPVFSREDLQKMGVRFSPPPEPARAKDRYMVVDLENLYDTEYRVGTENFYAITRYNRSFKYAAAVADLAAAVARPR